MSGVRSALMTGGTGYLGKYLIDLLLKKGIAVTCYVRESSNTQALPDNVSFTSSFGKIKQYDYFFHLATCYGRNNESDQDIRSVNVELPTEICQRLSSETIVFNFSTSLPANVNIYAQTKFEFSDYMKQLDEFNYFLNLKVEQFYGPGDKTFIGSLINYLKNNTKEIPLTLGMQKRDFIYVDDLIAAIETLLDKIDKIPQGYHDIEIGSGDCMTIKHVVETLKSFTGSTSELLFGKIPYRPKEPMELKADNKLISSLGWKPKVSFEEGIKKVVESL